MSNNIFIRKTLLFICVLLTKQLCPVSNLLPFMHHSKITINSMFKHTPNYPQTLHSYVFNYPTSILNSRLLQNIVTFHSIQWQENRYLSGINFHIQKLTSQTAMLISLSSYNITWNHFQIAILLNDYVLRSDIFMGDSIIINKNPSQSIIQNQKTIPHLIPIPTLPYFTDYSIFITGVQVQAKSLVQIDVIGILNRGFLQLIIKKNSQVRIKKIFINYIVFTKSQKNLKKTTEFFLYNFEGISYKKLGDDIPISQNYLFGISGFKFLIQSTFSLSFSIFSQNILQIETQNQFHFLKATFFGVCVHPFQACQLCGNSRIILSLGQENYCTQRCPNDTWVKIYDKGGRSCVKCAQILNMFLSQNNQCQCLPGYKLQFNKCVPIFKIQPLYSSKKQQECLEPNSVLKDTGQCVCKSGYISSPGGACLRKCGNGFWNGLICIPCLPGTYLREDLNECKECKQNCKQCQNHSSCKICSIGYLRNQKGECLEQCGDGRIFQHECDDKNKLQGDGCSSVCQIEDGYQCKVSDQTSPSVCSKIKFSIVEIKQELRGSSFILDCIFSEFQPKYSEQQLQKMILIAIEKVQNIPSQIYFSQDEIDYEKIRIVLHYFGNQLPTSDFEIQIRFLFPDGTISIRTVSTHYFQKFSVFNSRFDERRDIFN